MSECSPSTENLQVLKEARSLLFCKYDRLREEEVMEKVKSVEEAHGNQQHSEAWRIINEISGRKKSKEGQVTGTSADERVSTWYSHFRHLLGSAPNVENEEEDIPDILTNLNIDDGPFTAAELARVKSSLKQGKSAGPDGIPPEVFKYCQLDDITLEMCNLVLMNNEKPDQWSLSTIIPVPKSGDLSKTDNYRGISLTCIIAKVFNRMILNRIRGAIDPKLRDNQNGFREKRSTVAQILALRRIIEEVKRNNLPSVLTFIDFKKAFDSIHRGKMMKILKAYGVPPRLLQAVRSMYANTRAKVMTPDGETEEFDIMAGVMQGDTLAPFLFVIALDYALRQATKGREAELGFTITPRRSRRFPKVTLTDLDFADDICLLSNEIQQAQELLTRVESECGKVGLTLNAKKTEFITFNTSAHLPLTTNKGSALKEVRDFKYLGSWINATESDIKVRKALAWKALNSMKKVWYSGMSRSVKISFFLATVESVLLYGSESWTLTPTLQKSLDGCYTRMLRVALNISWKDHVTNASLYGELPRVSDKVAFRRLGLAGHCYRHPELPACQLVLWEPSHGTKQRGGQRASYIRVLKQDTGMEHTSELATCMENRTDWRIRCRARLRTTYLIISLVINLAE